MDLMNACGMPASSHAATLAPAHRAAGQPALANPRSQNPSPWVRMLAAHPANIGAAGSSSVCRDAVAAQLYRRRQTRAHASAQQPGSIHEVRICTNKVCKKQGSQEILKFAQDLGFEELDVKPCGCLGNCGNGPNLAILPQELVLRHVSTPADFADVLRWQCNVEISDEVLKATELRLAGNALARSGDFAGAVQRYTAGLAAGAARGQHLLHSNLSAAYLQLGEREAALEHARLAVDKAPGGFHNAYIRLVDALYALKRFAEAAAAVQDACRADPGFASLPEYKVIMQALSREGVPRLQAAA